MQLPRSFAIFAIVTFLVAPLGAQRSEAATKARTLMHSARALLLAGDTLAAADSAVAAAHAWPKQQAYWSNAAAYALLGRRNDQALDALTTFTAMGGGWSADDPDLTRLASFPRFQDLARIAELRVRRSNPFAEIADRGFHAEGIGWDPRTHRLYVGSVHRGVVMVVAPNGQRAILVPAGTAGLRAVFGVTVDTLRNLLWVSSADVPERDGGATTPKSPTAVHAFALESGTPVGRWEIPADGEDHLLGDISLAPDGRIWATDSYQPGLYRVPRALGEGPMERVPIDHPDWASLQGIAFNPDGRSAWLADWTTGLYRLDLDSWRVTPVEGTPNLMLLGIDGLYRTTANTLIAIQNGNLPPRVVALSLDSTGTIVTRLDVLDHPPGPGEPTLGAVTPEGFLFVANSLWPLYDRNGKPPPAGSLPITMIRRLALP